MKHKQNNNWQHLVGLYFSNKISKQELEEMLSKMDAGKDIQELDQALRQQWELSGTNSETAGQDHWNQLFTSLMEKARIEEAEARRRKSGLFRRILRISVAAAVLIAAGSAYYFRTVNKESVVPVKGQQAILTPQDLAPGKEGAILTLADGKKISLDSNSQAILAVQGDATISLQKGEIVYSKKGNNSNEVLYNTIETPRGRQFQLLLADGTKVWLNAASSLRYPATFDGGERKVEISGEAYFEVATKYSKDNQHKIPFTVAIKNGQEPAGSIEVLGTHFNVNTYDHVNQVQATLLEGAVRISNIGSTEILHPGQQAVYQSGTRANEINVMNKVDLEQVMAWKNGYFSFANSDLESVMRQIARWYDVDITYEGKIPQRKFGGEISRNLNASQVLKVLEESGVHFRIEGRRIVVTP